MIESGHAAPLGASYDGDGVNFAVYSAGAERVELCLFDSDDNETERLTIDCRSDDVWHCFLPGRQPGQRYGYRVHGRYAPDEGLRFNPNKLLVDPYARELSGEFSWSPAVFDFGPDSDSRHINQSDSAPFVPKGVVTAGKPDSPGNRPNIPWAETIIYESNVRGYTMRHPDVPELERGTFRGMRNASVLSYLKSLGITSVELMPVQEFIDEQFLTKRGMRNFWGYNTINYFAPARRYARGNATDEFRGMLNAIHDAGMEVLIDIAYNHTAEGDSLGPTISFRGIDNLSYYRTALDDAGHYVNDTGCGNTINVDHPRVRALIVDNLRYWAMDMGVDGFRFDLAAVLGRTADGFTTRHPLLQAIENDDVLRHVKMIAEPWDLGSDGYQLGAFPPRWAEWNDRYRDSLRRFWRGDRGEATEFAKRLLGSADIFEARGRMPAAGINLVTAHDGFTLADVVSYEQRHNEANGEHNRDGHSHNFSKNFGVEGATENPRINGARNRQRLNMLATLFLSQGTPMLLAGDEFGNSQQGNNNAYAQDNEVGWLDWSGLGADPGFHKSVREIIGLRKRIPLFGQTDGWRDVEWLRPGCAPVQSEDRFEDGAIGLVFASMQSVSSGEVHAVALLMNPTDDAVDFVLPQHDDRPGWRIAFSSAAAGRQSVANSSLAMPARSFVCLTSSE